MRYVALQLGIDREASNDGTPFRVYEVKVTSDTRTRCLGLYIISRNGYQYAQKLGGVRDTFRGRGANAFESLDKLV